MIKKKLIMVMLALLMAGVAWEISEYQRSVVGVSTVTTDGTLNQYFDTRRDILFIESRVPIEGCGVAFYEPPHPWEYNEACLVRATVYTSNKEFIEIMESQTDVYIKRKVYDESLH